MSIEEAVRNSILGIYLLTDDQSVLSNNDSFLQKGIIDSCDVLGLITFLEEEFGIHVEDEEVAPENLDSVNNVVRYVERKQQTRRDLNVKVTKCSRNAKGVPITGCSF